MSGDSPDRKRRIFISYRRRGGAPSAEFLFHRLAQRLGEGLVFYDVAGDIKPGDSFPLRLREALNDCEIVLAVIDQDWIEPPDDKGQRRLDDPEDWVRIELETALLADKLVVPLWAYHDQPLTATSLPESLRPFAELQRQKLRQGSDGQHDFEDLAQLLANKLDIKLRSLLPPVFNVLPRHNPYFIGREAELRQLAERLNKDGIAVLSGLGGMGKTGTAVEYAYRHAAEYCVVLWATADTESNLFTGLVRLAHELDLPQKDSQDQNVAVEAGRRWLTANDGWLLILDNADTDESIKAIASLLPSRTGTAERRETGSGVDFRDNAVFESGQASSSRKSTPDPLARSGHILVTSRRSNVSKLGVTHQVTIAKLDPNDAHDFLRRRTGREDITDDELHALVNLTEEVGYLPLALEQAAAYIIDRGAKFADYLASYHQGNARLRLELLEKMPPEMGDREKRSLAVTWRLNFEEIDRESPASADLLRVFAFLAPDEIPFELMTLGAAELGNNVAAALTRKENTPLAVPELLAPLRRYSLIDIDANARTLSIHRLVQIVVQAALEEGGQESAWSQRVIAAVGRAFPKVEFGNWTACRRLLPHVVALTPRITINTSESSTPEHPTGLLVKAGTYQTRQGHYKQAEALLIAARDVAELAMGKQSTAVADALDSLASLYYEQSAYEEAEETFARALSIRRASSLENRLKLADTLYGLATLHTQTATRRQQFQEAESLFQEALDVRRQELGARSPEVADVLLRLGRLYSRWRGERAHAEDAYRQALDIYRSVRDASDPSIGVALAAVAHICKAGRRYSEAEQYYREALAILETACRPDHPGVAECRGHLADLLRVVGRLEEARDGFLQSLNALQRAFGPEHSSVAGVLSSLGKLHHQLRDYPGAEQYLKEALRIREAIYLPDHAAVAESLCDLARLYSDMGWSKHLDAVRLATRALTLASHGDNVDQQRRHRAAQFDVWLSVFVALFTAVGLPAAAVFLVVGVMMWIASLM